VLKIKIKQLANFKIIIIHAFRGNFQKAYNILGFFLPTLESNGGNNIPTRMSSREREGLHCVVSGNKRDFFGYLMVGCDACNALY